MNEVDLAVGAVETVLSVVLGQIVAEKRNRRAERFLGRIARTDSGLDALVQRLASSERFEALITAAVMSASAADAEHRVSALAAIVRRGLEGDDATISSVLRAERAVHDLDAVELRVLLIIADGPRAEIPAPNDPSATVIGGLDITDLRHAIAGPKGIHESLAARLVARGLIEDCALGISITSPDGPSPSSGSKYWCSCNLTKTELLGTEVQDLSRQVHLLAA